MTERFFFEPILDSYVAVAAIGVVMLLLLLLRPSFAPLTQSQRLTLAGLRLGVALVIVTLMLRPTCISMTTHRQSAALVILLDKTESMLRPHDSEGKLRWEAQLETLRKGQPLLADLADEWEVKVYAYDTVLHPLDLNDGEIAFPKAPDGAPTNIGEPLDDAVRAARGKRLVGVILMGDGTQTDSDPQLDLEDAVEGLRALRLPLYTVTFGSEADIAQTPDIELVYLPDDASTFVKNEVLIRASLALRSFANKEILVKLIHKQRDGQSVKETVINTQRISTTQNHDEREIEFPFIPQETGEYELAVRAELAPDAGSEEDTDNNELTMFLRVFEGGLRVLYLEGEPRQEQFFLRRSIDASQDIDMDYQWIDKRTRDKWPLDLSKQFSDPLYNVFIIGDLDSSALFKADSAEETLKALEKAIGDQGKGLIMLGGYHSFGPGRYQHTPLVDVLPIQMKREEAQDFGPRISRDLHEDRELQMLPTVPHFITYLAPGDDNKRLWTNLPPLLGANKFAKVKPSAEVLAQSPDGLPLLVKGDYGKGRVLAFAGDSTWRWWMRGHKDEHRRFWRQVVLWLARRDELTEKNVWIKLPQRRFAVGKKVTFTAGVETATGEAITEAKFTAAVVLPNNERIPISLSFDGVTHTGQIDQTSEDGTYRIEVGAHSPNGEPIDNAETSF
ncbi:MAG: hypothetical protein IH991_25095, partial [Planctomycetes bacterium]|nr:hypothetical protein [Planctomycetota bacterium]